MAFTQVIKTLGSVMEGMKTAVNTWLSQNITNPSNPPLDRSLSLSNACAPADMVGDVKKEIDYNRDTECDNVDALGNMDSKRIITLKWEHGGIDNATGATNNDGSTTRSRDTTYYSVNDLTSIINNSQARLVVIFYSKNNDTYTYMTYHDVNAGTSYRFLHNNLYVRFDIRNGLSSAYLVKLLGEKYPLNQIVNNLNSLSLQYKGVISNNSDLNDIVFESVYFKPSDISILNDPLPTKSGMLYTLGDSSYVGQQIFITTSSTNNVIYSRRKIISGWGDWENLIPEIPERQKEISILFVGNSLTQDGIAYLPYLLKNYYPEIIFKFYIWYIGGYNLGQQYTAFINDDKAAIFSIAENSASWTNYNNSKTMADILTSYTFDIVCMQEYFNYKQSYTVSDLSDWNNCRDYIRSHYTGGNGLEFISLFHAPLRSNADSVFDLTVSGNNLILQQTIADDMIPNGIAVYRALSTALDALGDSGHLSPDGTHTQEGLPCLLQTYVTALWLFDRLGLSRSVYGCPLRMTTDIYTSINVPGPNLGSGVITGTDADNILAQEVAIKAYKEGKYYVENNIFLPSN